MLNPAYPLTWYESLAFLAVGILAGAGLTDAQSPAPFSGERIVVTDARSCATLAVYKVDELSDDPALRAAVGAVVLNSYSTITRPEECATAVGSTASGEFSRARWNRALETVAAVDSGDYPLPRACITATRILPPESSEAATTPCVIQGYSFVGGEQ